MNGGYEIKLWKLNACLKRKSFYIFENLSQPLAFFCVSKSINRGPVKKKNSHKLPAGTSFFFAMSLPKKIYDKKDLKR